MVINLSSINLIFIVEKCWIFFEVLIVLLNIVYMSFGDTRLSS
jgi:hypothetical protein